MSRICVSFKSVYYKYHKVFSCIDTLTYHVSLHTNLTFLRHTQSRVTCTRVTNTRVICTRIAPLHVWFTESRHI